MAQARAELHRLSSWCECYRREHGGWPDLAQLTAQQQGLPAIDPWGRAYLVEVLPGGRSAVLRCRGDDGCAGTCDDVVSPPAVAPAEGP